MIIEKRTIKQSCQFKQRIKVTVSEKAKNHLNVSTADGATTSLVVHFGCARRAEALMTTWDQSDALFAWHQETNFAAVVIRGQNRHCRATPLVH